ncbi:hypothetical protein L226DRAFT_52961 [Lentinus tigrinus ALCF2SS1-7]|uniref:uncharacterized protein n=1 Tax=Lentinus tigrinus ALCF2SS1-7 TaxID=1328758 RepID=UPI001165FDD0|nr:hypothetical protein L226DRAFT_52961 [Lentinus tigrinus ALCF2SS1-7]
MSTASTAMDVVKISEKLGQEKVMNCGFSYESVLGHYFSAMYPEKVDRVIIDGVFDSHNHRAALWNSNLFDFEKVVESLFTYCHQTGPLQCPLYESTPDKIRARYFAILDAVAHKPVLVPLAEFPMVRTCRDLVWQLFGTTYRPLVGYNAVVDVICAIETGNQTGLVALAPKIHQPAQCDCAADQQHGIPKTRRSLPSRAAMARSTRMTRRRTASTMRIWSLSLRTVGRAGRSTTCSARSGHPPEVEVHGPARGKCHSEPAAAHCAVVRSLGRKRHGDDGHRTGRVDLAEPERQFVLRVHGLKFTWHSMASSSSRGRSRFDDPRTTAVPISWLPTCASPASFPATYRILRTKSLLGCTSSRLGFRRCMRRLASVFDHADALLSSHTLPCTDHPRTR